MRLYYPYQKYICFDNHDDAEFLLCNIHFQVRHARKLQYDVEREVNGDNLVSQSHFQVRDE